MANPHRDKHSGFPLKPGSTLFKRCQAYQVCLYHCPSLVRWSEHLESCCPFSQHGCLTAHCPSSHTSAAVWLCQDQGTVWLWILHVKVHCPMGMPAALAHKAPNQRPSTFNIIVTMHACVLRHPVVSDSLQIHGLYLPSSSVHEIFQARILKCNIYKTQVYMIGSGGAEFYSVSSLWDLNCSIFASKQVK